MSRLREECLIEPPPHVRVCQSRYAAVAVPCEGRERLSEPSRPRASYCSSARRQAAVPPARALVRSGPARASEQLQRHRVGVVSLQQLLPFVRQLLDPSFPCVARSARLLRRLAFPASSSRMNCFDLLDVAQCAVSTLCRVASPRSPARRASISTTLLRAAWFALLLPPEAEEVWDDSAPAVLGQFMIDNRLPHCPQNTEPFR